MVRWRDALPRLRLDHGQLSSNSSRNQQQPRSSNFRISLIASSKTHPTFLSIAILLCILQGCCDNSQDPDLSSVYGSLVNGGGGLRGVNGNGNGNGNGGGGGGGSSNGNGNGNGDDWGASNIPPDAERITAMIGESFVFNCHVEFPEGYPVPYIVQWDKKGTDIPIHIWYDGYPTHSGEGYEGRVARVNPNSSYGLASLNLTAIRESDRGWYNCRVYFLNRSPPPQNSKNISGSWYHLDVHAPPRFVHTSDDVVYTKIGKSVILHCRAEGTPPPEIIWYKDSDPVQPSVTVSIVNEGTELRIAQIKNEDIGDYTCIARNGEGKIHHVVKVLIAGSAVIINPPQNMTKVEGEKVVFPCEWRAMPANASVLWFRDGVPVRQISGLESRVETPAEGSLIINPISADDSGFFECRVSNGIGEIQTALAYLNVEYPAQVTYTPTVQYLPNRLAGVVRCYITANPPIQFVMWTRDKHLLEPYETDGFAVMTNGSLLIDRVRETHQGMYTCTPYNVHGTKGASLQMQVIVKEPPKFEVTPDPLYQRKLGSSVEIPCSAVAPNGTTSPLITWQRRDGRSLARDRVRVIDGVLTIEDLQQADYGEYECVASNEVATLVTSTQIIVEGTKPHAPYNITASCAVFTVTLSWIPGYAGGPDFQQNYVVWYRLLGDTKWETVPVTPRGSTRITIRNLSPGKTYQFQVVGTNDLGDGYPSEIVNVTTKGIADITPNGNEIKTTVHTSSGTAGTGVAPPTIGTGTGGTGTNNVISPGPLLPGASTSANTDTNGVAGPELIDYSVLVYPTDSSGNEFIPVILRPEGPKPGAPWNVTVEPGDNYNFIITWHAPLDTDVHVSHYLVRYRLSTDSEFKLLSKKPIKPPETYLSTRNLDALKHYVIKVEAYTLTGSHSESDELKYSVPKKDISKAVTAGLVGGMLFFIIAIILSVCAVKICNRRKRRKQEKAYNMVACRLTDARANGGQIPTQPQIPIKKSGVARVLVVISWAKKAYRSVGRVVGLSIIHLLDLRLRRHAVILTTRRGRPPSITSITLSLGDIGGHPHGIRRPHSSLLTLPPGPPRGTTKGITITLPWDVLDESSDDGGFLAPRPLRYYPRGRRRFDFVLPGSFLPSTTQIRPERFVPRPLASSPLPRPVSRTGFLGPSVDLSQMGRFPVLVQVHQPQEDQPYVWTTTTSRRGRRHIIPQAVLTGPTPPPWEAERIRDTLARDLDYLERQVPPFLRYPIEPQPQVISPRDRSLSGTVSRFQERSSSSGFQSGSKHTMSTMPSGTSLGVSPTGELLIRPIALPEQPPHVQSLYATHPYRPPLQLQPRYATLPPRTYENWPRREIYTPPVYTIAARSPSSQFEVSSLLGEEVISGAAGLLPQPALTVPTSEPSPSTRTLLDMSVDDPYEFDAVLPDTSPEIASQIPGPMSSTASAGSIGSRFRRTRDRYESMEARVAAMKEEFFEYRRRQKKRMESEC